MVCISVAGYCWMEYWYLYCRTGGRVRVDTPTFLSSFWADPKWSCILYVVRKRPKNEVKRLLLWVFLSLVYIQITCSIKSRQFPIWYPFTMLTLSIQYVFVHKNPTHESINMHTPFIFQYRTGSISFHSSLCIVHIHSWISSLFFLLLHIKILVNISINSHKIEYNQITIHWNLKHCLPTSHTFWLAALPINN